MAQELLREGDGILVGAVDHVEAAPADQEQMEGADEPGADGLDHGAGGAVEGQQVGEIEQDLHGRGLQQGGGGDGADLVSAQEHAENGEQGPHGRLGHAFIEGVVAVAVEKGAQHTGDKQQGPGAAGDEFGLKPQGDQDQYEQYHCDQIDSDKRHSAFLPPGDF